MHRVEQKHFPFFQCTFKGQILSWRRRKKKESEGVGTHTQQEENTNNVITIYMYTYDEWRHQGGGVPFPPTWSGRDLAF